MSEDGVSERTVKSAGNRCMFCKHWRDIQGARKDGLCTRYPQTVIKQYADWCGEFRRAPKCERQAID